MRFEGKVALVTGASRGIGRAIALALAAEGADVAVNYAGSEAAAKEVAAEIEAMGRKAFVIQADIASTEASTAMVDAVVKEFGRVDVLVNNAGITRDGLLMRMKEEDWDAVITTNLKGVFNCTKAAIKYMMKQKSGNIVNISSVMGINPARLQCAFTVAKAGVIMMSRVMALELAPYNIRVNCLCPGSIMSEKTYAKFYSDPVKAESLLSHVPMKRAGEGHEIADGILYLSSDFSTYTTGNNLVIDGGWQCGFTRDW